MYNEFHGSNNQNITQQIFNINIDSNTTTEQIKELCSLGATINASKDVQRIINDLFDKAASIVNNEDILFYITEKNKKILLDCVSKLELFKQYFYKYNDGQSKIYYNNLFSILFILDLDRVKLLYDEMPQCFKNEKHILYIYGCALEFTKKYDDAKQIFNDLYLETSDITYFIQYLICLLEEGKYPDIYNNTRKLKKDEYDKYGYISSIQMISMYEIKKIKSENDIKKLRSKFNDMPLYYSTASYLIKKFFNPKSTIIKTYIKDGLNLLKDCPIGIKSAFIDKAIITEENVQLVKFLKNNLNESIYLRILLLNILQKIKEKEKEDFDIMNKIIIELEEKNVDILDFNKAKAQISLENHKELEAINYFSKAYDINPDDEIAYIALNLIIKNHDDCIYIHKYIERLKLSSNPKYVISAACGFKFLRNNVEAYKYANKALYLLKNRFDINIYRKYFGITMFEENIEKEDFNIVNNDCAIYLENSEDSIIIVIDSDILKDENIFNAKCYSPISKVAVSLINKEVNDNVLIDGNQYKISNIISKMSFFIKNVSSKFRSVNIDKRYFREFTGENAIEEIKELLIEDREKIKEILESYDIERNDNKNGLNTLPLSFLCNSSSTYKEVIEFLLYSPENKLYTGEKNYYLLKNEKIVIDLTSLIVLKEFDCLNLLENYKSSLYFTKSLKNKLMSIFDQVSNEKIDGMKVFVDNEDNLVRTDTTKESKKYNIDYWRDIISLVDESNIIDFESEIGLDQLDKSQIDMMHLASDYNMIYICDDLLIRKLANSTSNNRIKMSNSCSIIDNLYHLNEERYLDIIKQLTDCKYIYCVDIYTLYYIFNLIIRNDNLSKHIDTFKSIIKNLFNTKFLYNLHINCIYQFLNIAFEKFNLTEDVITLLQIIIDIAKENSEKFGYQFNLSIPNK